MSLGDHEGLEHRDHEGLLSKVGKILHYCIQAGFQASEGFGWCNGRPKHAGGSGMGAIFPKTGLGALFHPPQLPAQTCLSTE